MAGRRKKKSKTTSQPTSPPFTLSVLQDLSVVDLSILSAFVSVCVVCCGMVVKNKLRRG